MLKINLKNKKIISIHSLAKNKKNFEKTTIKMPNRFSE